MRVKLISMPFGPLHFPSIALAQLTSAVKEKFGDAVTIDLHYLTHDFGEFFGQEHYNTICQNEKSADPNFGDWVFSQAAFPDRPDNTDAYFDLVPEAFRADYRNYFEKNLRAKKEGMPAFMEELIDRYSLADANLVGYTSMFAQTVASIAMAKALRRRNPELYQVMGGANCEFPMGVEYVHNFDCFNAIFSGPGLISFPTFLEKFQARDWAAIDRINGVFTPTNSVSAGTFPDDFALREKAGALLKTGIREIGDERPVGQLLELDYDDFLDNYDRRFSREIEEPFIVFETSRGCWWGQKSHCTFCGLNGLAMNYRSMGGEIALEFLQNLIKRYRGRVEHFECVDNILPQHFTKEVFPYLNPPEDVSFFWEVKANLKNEDLLAMAQANVWEIQPGIEALNTDTLRLMKKGATAFINIALLRDAPMYYIKVLWYLLMGFPGEKEEVFAKYVEDFPRLVHLRPPVALVPVEYHRFSPYYDRASEFGLKLAPREFYGVNYPLPEKVLANLAYYFRDTQMQSDEDHAVSKVSVDESKGIYLPPSLDSSYKSDLKQWWERLNDGWDYWNTRFEGSDGAPPATLHFYPSNGNGVTVMDTRTGKRVRHRLTADEHKILLFLVKPLPIKAVNKAFENLGEDEVQRIVSRLYDELMLLFREGELYMSLVPEHRHVEIPPALKLEEPSVLSTVS